VKRPQQPSASRALGKSELLARVAGQTLPENIVYEIRTHGLLFAPSAAYQTLLTGGGGPFASLISGLSALAGGELLAASKYDLPLLSILQLFGAYSQLIGIVSFRSFRVGLYPGAGMFLRALLRSKYGAKQLSALCIDHSPQQEP
jgi:hypothetical protein